MRFTEDTRLREIYGAERLAPVRDCLVSGGSFFQENGELTLAQLQRREPGWAAADVLYGLRRLEGRYEVCPVYPRGCSRLDAVKLLWLPAAAKTRGALVILLAGGAYGTVCTMLESLPAAARLNELGYDCFCLNYRTAVQESFVKGLFPEPLEDLAAAWRYIRGRQESLGVDAGDYALCGFSAGGHTAALWGTEHLGARRYGLPQPKCLILGYPLLTMANVPEGPVKTYMCGGLFGAGYTDEDIRRYDACRHADAAYPPTYIARCADDPTVSVRDGDAMKAALGERCVLRQGETGGHGFGLGTGTALEGWIGEAAAWMERL